MKERLSQYWFTIKSSLWFLPSTMSIISLVLAFAFIELDTILDYDGFPVEWFLYGGQPEGARSVLSTIASSMVTISGVTFSITLVALALASSQYGPRLLRNFIADKGNQFVIGTFISTFIYSLMVLLSIRGAEDDNFVPKIAVFFAFLLAIFSLGVFIYFIHHLTKSIQADYVITASFDEFKRVAKDLMSAGGEDVERVDEQNELDQLRNSYSNTSEETFLTSGYVQSVNFQGSAEWALKHDLAVVWHTHPGKFATAYEPYATLYYNKKINKETLEELRKFVIIGVQRTPHQDILFPIKQIAEVAVRALSPGTNDPHTAITCIKWMGAALCELAQLQFRPLLLKGVDGEVRVVTNRISYQEFVDTCFDHLRLYSKTNNYVTMEILSALQKPMPLAKSEAFLDVLKKKASAVFKETKRDLSDEMLKAMTLVYRKVVQ